MQSSKLGGILIFAFFAIGVFLLLRRSESPGAGTTLHLKTKNDTSERVSGGKRYQNKETRHIEWNSDGLPTKITIERDYAIV